MPVYARILVPLDGSDVDHAILGHVIALARLCEADVVLLRVAHFHTRDSKTHEVDEAEEVLAHAESHFRGTGLRVRAVVGKGEVADDIVEQADALSCDLIAMATHGHGTLGRLVYGSTVDKVRRASDVPLLLMNARTAGASQPVAATTDERTDDDQDAGA